MLVAYGAQWMRHPSNKCHRSANTNLPRDSFNLEQQPLIVAHYSFFWRFYICVDQIRSFSAVIEELFCIGIQTNSNTHISITTSQTMSDTLQFTVLTRILVLYCMDLKTSSNRYKTAHTHYLLATRRTTPDTIHSVAPWWGFQFRFPP